jgi:hypothetical protein
MRPEPPEVSQAEYGLGVTRNSIREHRGQRRGVGIDAAEDRDAPILRHVLRHVAPVR